MIEAQASPIPMILLTKGNLPPCFYWIHPGRLFIISDHPESADYIKTNPDIQALPLRDLERLRNEAQ